MGIPRLRNEITRLISDVYGRKVCPDTEVTITSGGTEALFVGISSLVHRGDEVIIIDPSFDAFAPIVEFAGGIPVRIPLSGPPFKMDWAAVAAAVSSKTKLIVVNVPHNPTGMNFEKSDWQQLEALVEQHDLLCLSDEVYEFMAFDQPPMGVHSFPKLAARSVAVSSFGKTFHVTGWKMGYCVAPAPITAELRKLHQYVTFASFTPAQHVFADMLRDERQSIDGVAKFYKEKLKKFETAMEGSRFKLVPCAGTYFQAADYSAIAPNMGDVEFCEWITVTHKVAAVPLSVFYDQPPANQRLVRFCFAKEDATLISASDILKKIMSEVMEALCE
eukprot:Selendium_serpulae@DN6247_c0_g1_i10.p1